MFISPVWKIVIQGATLCFSIVLCVTLFRWIQPKLAYCFCGQNINVHFQPLSTEPSMNSVSQISHKKVKIGCLINSLWGVKIDGRMFKIYIYIYNIGGQAYVKYRNLSEKVTVNKFQHDVRHRFAATTSVQRSPVTALSRPRHRNVARKSTEMVSVTVCVLLIERPALIRSERSGPRLERSHGEIMKYC